MNSILVDTNVLIYALDQSSLFFERSVKILNGEQNQLFIATKNISEYFAVCSKLLVDRAHAVAFYEELRINATILYPNPASLQHFQSLLAKYQPKGNRVYDVEIVSIMMSYELKKIATFNETDFKSIDEVEIYAPK